MARFNFRNILRFFENRSFDNQSWIKDWLRGRDVGEESFAGIPITPERAVKYSAVLACSRIISEGIASVPLFVYKRIEGGKEKATDHYLYDILHLQPNERMSSFSFREMMILHLLFWGNSYSNIVYDNSGGISALWPLLPWRMKVESSNGKLQYKYRLPDNTEKIIPNEYVLHIPGMSFDGLVGKSIISCAREAIGLGLALEEFGSRFFGQGTQFGGFVEHPKNIGEKAEKNLRAALRQKYKGLNNAHRLIILEEGMKFTPNHIPLNDAQFLESRKFQKNEIAMMFNVSPHLIKDLDRATLNNIEHLEIEHVVYTLRPWCVRIEQAENIKLLTKSERQVFYIEHLLEGLLRGDIKSRYESYAIGRQWGWLSADDIRALENMNPLPDGQGKIYYMPLNMMPADQVASMPNMRSIEILKPKAIESRAIRSATHKSRLANNYRGLFADATSRIIQFEKADILKKAKLIFGKRNINLLNFSDFLNKFYIDKSDEITKRIKPVVGTYGKVVSEAVSEEIGTVIDDAKLDGFLDDYTSALNKRYAATSKSRLTGIAQNAVANDLDAYGEIEGEFSKWEKERPSVVSLKETIKIAGAVSYFSYKLANIQKIIWINTGSKSCPFCEELNGRVVGIEQPYMSKDSLMEADGKEPLTFSSDVFHPPLHGGCVCMLSAG
ncbi:MAG: phage portal protein [Atribacterota bacterium]|nr:phage portal protein [Atribacterota bacterium]